MHVGVIAAAVGRTLALAGQPEVRCSGPGTPVHRRRSV